jgi:hypothetical protein
LGTGSRRRAHWQGSSTFTAARGTSSPRTC